MPIRLSMNSINFYNITNITKLVIVKRVLCQEYRIDWRRMTTEQKVVFWMVEG